MCWNILSYRMILLKFKCFGSVVQSILSFSSCLLVNRARLNVCLLNSSAAGMIKVLYFMLPFQFQLPHKQCILIFSQWQLQPEHSDQKLQKRKIELNEELLLKRYIITEVTWFSSHVARLWIARSNDMISILFDLAIAQLSMRHYDFKGHVIVVMLYLL